MMLFRKARDDEEEAIHELAQYSGIGITTLPKDHELLKTRLAWSSHSIKKKSTTPGQDYYFFVLEDTSNHRLVGTSAIKTSIGASLPFYTYQIVKQTQACHTLSLQNTYQTLHFVNTHHQYSELCTLFLEPAYRHHGNGLLLSRARLLFMAEYPHRFNANTLAEMRGISDEQGHSPFWNHVISHFFNMPFAEADRLTLATNKEFIADLMPKYPLYVELLHPDAIDVIGKPHPLTQPAFNILAQEGFQYRGYIDIFDAGPILEIETKDIQTLNKSKTLVLEALTDDLPEERVLLSNNKQDYRATIGQILCQNNTCLLNKNTAELLQLTPGDTLRIAPLSPQQNGSPS